MSHTEEDMQSIFNQGKKNILPVLSSNVKSKTSYFPHIVPILTQYNLTFESVRKFCDINDLLLHLNFHYCPSDCHVIPLRLFYLIDRRILYHLPAHICFYIVC